MLAVAHRRQVRPDPAHVMVVADDLPGLQRVNPPQSPLGIHVDRAAPARSGGSEQLALEGG